MPELLPENAMVYGIYEQIQTQVIFAGMNGWPVDINHLAVWTLLDRMMIDPGDQLEIFTRVIGIGRFFIEERQKEIKAEMDKSKHGGDVEVYEG